MTRLSNWKEESDLFEVVTGKMTDKEALKKVDEKKGIKNKVVINPKLTEAIKELGGELIEATEEDENGATVDPRKEAEKKSEEQKKKQIENKQKRAQMIKKQVLMKKLIAVRQGSEDIVAHYKPEGEMVEARDEVAIANRKWLDKRQKKIEQKHKEGKPVKPMRDYGEEVVHEAKVDAGKSPEEKEKVRNVRKFGVSHNVAGHGKLRRALHRSDRGDKKIKGDKSAYVEMEAKKNPNNLVEPRDGVDSAKEVNRATRKAAFRPFNKESVVKEGKKKGLWDNIHAKRKRGEKPAKPGDKDYPKTLNVEGIKQARKNVGADKCWDGYKAKGTKKKGGKEVPNCVKEGAAWTKKSGKNPEGGLNEKGRKSYERENPGSDLKAPQPEGGSRKKSFCARMGGMKKKLTSKKTANDPDSRINKSLRKWKCNEEDKAFNFVVNKLKAKYGSGVMTKGDKMPEPSAAQKKKNAAIRAKRAKEDHRDPTEKASDGRYSDRYSNRGSD